MLLRPHHLLCIHGFKGKGYSEAFVENMQVIIDQLKEDTEMEIQLTIGGDMICVECPKHVSDQSPSCQYGTCVNEERITALDSRALEALGLSEGERYTFKEVIDRIGTVFDEKKFHYVCAGCQWMDLGFCREGLMGLCE